MVGEIAPCELLIRYGADPKIPDVDGITPLRCAQYSPKLQSLYMNGTTKPNVMVTTFSLTFFHQNKRPCGNTGCTNPATKHCSKCKQRSYCSRDCQAANWKIHKKECSSLTFKSQLGVKLDSEAVKYQSLILSDGAEFMALVPLASLQGSLMNGTEVQQEVFKVQSYKLLLLIHTERR
jgi:hypothetical protein